MSAAAALAAMRRINPLEPGDRGWCLALLFMGSSWVGDRRAMGDGHKTRWRRGGQVANEVFFELDEWFWVDSRFDQDGIR
jgi:hypothetical protein